MKPHVWIDYTNHRGERSWREIIPHEISFEKSQWHSIPCYILHAFDVGKKLDREFACASIHAWSEGPKLKVGDFVAPSMLEKFMLPGITYDFIQQVEVGDKPIGPEWEWVLKNAWWERLQITAIRDASLAAEKKDPLEK